MILDQVKSRNTRRIISAFEMSAMFLRSLLRVTRIYSRNASEKHISVVELYIVESVKTSPRGFPGYCTYITQHLKKKEKKKREIKQKNAFLYQHHIDQNHMIEFRWHCNDDQ